MADPVQIGWDWSPGSEAKLERAILALEKYGKKEPLEALSWGMWYAAQSLRKSTKTAPKRRPLSKNRGNVPEFPAADYPHYVKVYQRKGAQAGTIRRVWIKAGEEESDPVRNIKRAGLAKDSWTWGIMALGKPPRARVKNRKRSRLTTVQKRPHAFDPSITMSNRLQYVKDALRHKGDADVATALDRGADGIFKFLIRRYGVYL